MHGSSLVTQSLGFALNIRRHIGVPPALLSWPASVDRCFRGITKRKRAYRVAAKLKGTARAWIDLGLVCIGDLEGQIGAFKTAVEISPDDSVALSLLGQAYGEFGEHQQAVGLLTRAIEGTYEDVGWIYVYLGMSALRLGDEAKAVDAFSQAAVLDNGIAFDTFFLQIAESFYGHDEAAADLRDRLSESNPRLATRFSGPHVGTVTYAKDSCCIRTDLNNGINYGDYFISQQEIETAAIPKLQVGNRVEFNTVGRRILTKRCKLLSR